MNGRYLLMAKVAWDESGYHAITYTRESLTQVKAVDKKYKEITPDANTIIYAWEDDEKDPEGSWYRIYTNTEGKWTKSKKIRLFDAEIRAKKLDYIHAWQPKYLKWTRQTLEEWPDDDIDPESWIHRNEMSEQDFIIWLYKEGMLND